MRSALNCRAGNSRLSNLVVLSDGSAMTDHEDIIVALRRITRAIDLHSKQLLKRTGLTAPQFTVLQTIERGGALAPSAIARQISLSQATVTTLLTRLESGGLITRRRDDKDKRIVLVTLTEKGMETTRAAPELLQGGFLRAFRDLEDWERGMLIAALQRIASLMDAEDVSASPIFALGEIEETDPEVESG